MRIEIEHAREEKIRETAYVVHKLRKINYLYST